ncbi:MAG: hypothetical protein EXX96DRAFT_475111, partial [Benjaminiella poitrasii]
ASRDDEISFVKDEVIKVTDDSDPDWWVGKKKDGSLGFFPSNVNKDDIPVPENTEEEPAQDNSETVDDQQQEAPAVPEQKKVDQVIGMVRVMEDYAMQEPGEISLPRGGIINVYEVIDDEWQRGELNGRVGRFPSKYVEDIDMPGRPDFGRQQSIDSSENQKSPLNDENSSGPKGGFKLAAYGVKQGGIGSLLAGGFPGLKKTGTVPKQEETAQPEVDSKKETVSSPSVPEATKPKPAAPTANVPAVPASGVPAVPAFMAFSEEPAGLPETSTDTPSTAISPTVPSVAPPAIVLHPYDADNDDELSLLRGEYVDVLDRHADEGWWKGKNERGETGVFPFNFVKEIEEDIVAPPMPSRSRKSVTSVNSNSTDSRPTSVNSPIAKPPTGPRPASVQAPSMTQPVSLAQRPSSVQIPSHNAPLPTPPKAMSLPIPQVRSPPPISEESIKEEEQYEADEEKPTSPERSEVEESPAFAPAMLKRMPSVPKEEHTKSPVVIEEDPISDDELKESGVDEEPFKPEVEKTAKTNESGETGDAEEQAPAQEGDEEEDQQKLSSIEGAAEPPVQQEDVAKEQASVSDDEFKEAIEDVVVVPDENVTATTETTEKEAEPKEEESTEEKGSGLDDLPSGPKLVNPTRARFGGGRARRAPQTPSQEPSQMEILQKELESTPAEEEKTTVEKPPVASPPAKPVKPIFAKFPTPFAAGATEEISKRNLRPTQTRRLWDEKPAEETNEKQTEEDRPARPTGVKNIASRFNFNGGGNEVLETKLKNHTKNEIEKVRKEFESLLQEERDKRLQLESLVHDLMAKLQVLEN